MARGNKVGYFSKFCHIVRNDSDSTHVPGLFLCALLFFKIKIIKLNKY